MPTNFSAWSAGSPIGIAKPRSSRSSSVTRMCVIEMESLVIPSSVASGSSVGSSSDASQKESILANRLVRSTSSSLMSPSGTPDVVSVLSSLTRRAAAVVVTAAARSEADDQGDTHRQPSNGRTRPGLCVHDVPPCAAPGGSTWRHANTGCPSGQAGRVGQGRLTGLARWDTVTGAASRTLRSRSRAARVASGFAGAAAGSRCTAPGARAPPGLGHVQRAAEVDGDVTGLVGRSDDRQVVVLAHEGRPHERPVRAGHDPQLARRRVRRR